MSLECRGAVVTGGGRGIGAAIAESLVAAGARVVLASRTETEAEGVAATAPCRLCPATRTPAPAAACRAGGCL